MERTNGTIKRLLLSMKADTWDILYHRSVFKWGAWLARINSFDPWRVTGHVFKHKDWRWIREVAAANHNNQLHGRRLRTWRWERPLYVCVGEDWPDRARDEEEWEEMLPERVSKRARTR